MGDCVTTKKGGCTPIRDGSDLSHPCDEGVCFGTPGYTDYVLTIRNPDNGVTITSASGGPIVTVIPPEEE